jgi:signal peptidase I
MNNALNYNAKHSAAAELGALPTSAQLKGELRHERYKNRYRTVLRSTVFTLVIVAAIAILVATLWLPVLEINGTSMTPTLTDGDIVFTLKTSDFSTGDVLAFYYNNKILIKRVIAGPGDWVDIDEEGNVYVNDELIDEPYLVERALGECDITLPYQVPDSRWFVMGDHRSTSVDSRSTTVGCVAQEQVVGRVLFRVWPLGRLGTVG